MAYIGKSPQNGVRNRFVYAATQGQTAFTGADADSKTLAISDALYTDVYQNGVKLKLTTDWSATTTTVTLVNAASADDVIEIISFDVFGIPDTVSAKSGGVFSGGITATAGTFNGTGGQITTDNSGHITSKQSLDVATAGGRFIGKSNRGELGQIAIEQTANSTDGGYIRFATSASGSTSPTDRMRIDGTGNVGIGTTSPDTMIHLSKGTTGGAGGGSAGITMTNKYDNPDNSWSITPQRSGVSNTGLQIRDETDSRTDMSFDGTGNVGIGVTSPSCILHASTGSSGSGLIDVARFENEGTSANDGARIQLTAGSSTSGAGIGCLGDALNSAHLVFHAGGNTERMRLTSAGNLTSTGTYLATGTIGGLGSYNNTTGASANVNILSSGVLVRSTSSLRYKNTINDATHGLTEVLKLRPVTYKGNNDGDTLFGGLIAEEVHDAGLTEFVTYNDDNEPDALAYGNMVSLCIKAIQELSKKNDALEARITALEAE